MNGLKFIVLFQVIIQIDVLCFMELKTETLVVPPNFKDNGCQNSPLDGIV